MKYFTKYTVFQLIPVFCERGECLSKDSTMLLPLLANIMLCDGEFQLKHVPAAKENDKQVFKKTFKNVTGCRDTRTAKSTETR